MGLECEHVSHAVVSFHFHVFISLPFGSSVRTVFICIFLAQFLNAFAFLPNFFAKFLVAFAVCLLSFSFVVLLLRVPTVFSVFLLFPILHLALCVFFFAVSGFSLQVWCAEHFFSSFFCFIFVLQLYLLPTIFACFCCSSSKLGFALRFGGLSPQVWPAAFFHIFCCSFIVPAFAFLFGALHFRCSLSPLPTFDLACPLSTLHAPLTVFSGSQLISCDCFPFWSCSPSIPFKLLEKCIKLFWCGALSSNTKVGTCKPFFP